MYDFIASTEYYYGGHGQGAHTLHCVSLAYITRVRVQNLWEARCSVQCSVRCGYRVYTCTCTCIRVRSPIYI